MNVLSIINMCVYCIVFQKRTSLIYATRSKGRSNKFTENTVILDNCFCKKKKAFITC